MSCVEEAFVLALEDDDDTRAIFLCPDWVGPDRDVAAHLSRDAFQGLGDLRLVRKAEAQRDRPERREAAHVPLHKGPFLHEQLGNPWEDVDILHTEDREGVRHWAVRAVECPAVEDLHIPSVRRLGHLEVVVSGLGAEVGLKPALELRYPRDGKAERTRDRGDGDVVDSGANPTGGEDDLELVGEHLGSLPDGVLVVGDHRDLPELPPHRPELLRNET
mmetsp:Transcript_9707/g.23300  ORF Transcript_9707/g.23300 Transcript_9707/m.23300 type:complete len:218 (-) Transcript_9707:368-1021(-)